MARLKEPKITGTIGNVTVYRMRGILFLRSKSSLTAERVKSDPAFASTMRFAGMMASAAPIASSIYQTLRKKDKRNFTFQFLTGKAFRLLKKGLTASEVRELMKELYGTRQSFIHTGLVKKTSAAIIIEEEQGNIISMSSADYRKQIASAEPTNSKLLTPV